ncbi:hypothetical protein ON010_g2214 [Phytophthora cinnamomi]|nr:hypothetical protein ON010_g2214 [Phytophthora cinnamomi]
MESALFPRRIVWCREPALPESLRTTRVSRALEPDVSSLPVQSLSAACVAQYAFGVDAADQLLVHTSSAALSGEEACSGARRGHFGGRSDLDRDVRHCPVPTGGSLRQCNGHGQFQLQRTRSAVRPSVHHEVGAGVPAHLRVEPDTLRPK